MTRLVRLAASLVLALVVVSCAGEGGSSDSAQFGRRGRDIVEAMAEGRFGEVRDALHPRLKGNLTSERLEQAWDEFVEDHGSITGIGQPQVEEGNGTLVTVGLDMTKQDGRAQIRFLPTGQVVGLDFGDVTSAAP